MHYKLLLFILFISLFGQAQQVTQTGKPFITNYYPKEYGGHPQNWAIVQDKRGVLFIGNGSRLIEYDGKNWMPVETPIRSIFRALGVDSSGTVYIGAEDELGYLQSDLHGKWQYISLVPKLKQEDRNFGEIRRIVTSNNNVYFISTNKFFRYDGKTVKAWYPKTVFRLVFNAGDRIFVRQDSIGLQELKNDSLVLLPLGKQFAGKSICFMLPYDDKTILIGTKNDGLVLMKNHEMAPLLTDADAYIKENRLYHGIKLSNGNYALATDFGGIVIINPQGKLVQLFNKKTGLQSETVNFLFEDNLKNLWIALNVGISKVELNYPITQFGEESELFDIITTIYSYNGKIYAGTMNGIYYLEYDTRLATERKPHYRFIKVKGLTDSCLDLEMIDNNLFAAAQSGLYEVQGDQAKLVFSTELATRIHQYRKNSSYILLGTNNGVQLIDHSGGKFLSMGKINGTSREIRNFVEDSNGNIWLSDYYNGVLKLTFKNGVINCQPAIEKFDTTNGLPTLDGVGSFFIGNKLLITTSKGIFTYKYPHGNTSAVSGFFTEDFSFQYMMNNAPVTYTIMEPGKNGDIWCSTSRGIFLLKKNRDLFKFDNTPFTRLLQSPMYSLFADTINNVIWFGGSDGLFCYNANTSRRYDGEFAAIIRNVTAGKDSVIYWGENSRVTKTASVLKYVDNSVTFEFAALFFESERSNQYSYMLEGFNSDWSNWSTEAKAVYTNIPEGEYTFKVKAKNIYGAVCQPADYKFRILSPWFKTTLAYIIYIVMLGLLVFLIILIFSRRLRRINLRLEKVIRERTAEVHQQKEEIQAQNEQLHEINKQLEKLSIVARETVNAIIIMDKEGNLEWVNESLMKIYGYTLEQLKKENNYNIINLSGNPNIKNILSRCIKNKSTLVYESESKTKSGKLIWTHTTLTPILDEFNEVSKIVAVDTDITRIKRADDEIQKQSRLLEVANRSLEKNNLLITDSIKYAKRIQESLLPRFSTLRSCFSESFIFYTPRDIVSGDFYWHSEQQDKIFLAAVDCTGHGVPGAFMSMIGNALLNKIINEDKIYVPSRILEEVHAGIVAALKYGEEGDAHQDDGMNISLCCVDKSANEVQISCASQTVCVINNGQLRRIEGDIYSLGGTFARKVTPVFTNHIVKIEKGLTIYLYSDGYQDQFGGENDTKFMVDRFEKLLFDNHLLGMSEQLTVLKSIFSAWKGVNKQVDDVLVIGVRFNDRYNATVQGSLL